MYEHYKESALPDTYRRREVACLTATLALQRSARLAGLSGMGKSNLLRFLVSHPHILEEALSSFAPLLCCLHIDGNKLSPVNAQTFYRECIFLLQPQQGIPTATDAYVLYKQLELALQQLERSTWVILVIDRAESLYEVMGREFFGQLRSLRDEARAAQMLFILGSHRPLGDLYELEKMFTATCWVGPLSTSDRTGFFERHRQRLDFSLDPQQQQVLWRLSGGHPGLLKNSLERLLWPDSENLGAAESDLKQALLDYEPVQKYCRQLWADLTPVEQEWLKHGQVITGTGPDLGSLQASGLLVEREGRWQLFSPLWQAYLEQYIWPRQVVGPMRIEIETTRRQVRLQWRGRTTETIITRHLVFQLLRVLSTAPGQFFSKDELMNAIYQDEQATELLEDALFQLVTALRKRLDPLVKQLCPAMTESCIQNARGVGYRLLVELPAS